MKINFTSIIIIILILLLLINLGILLSESISFFSEDSSNGGTGPKHSANSDFKQQTSLKREEGTERARPKWFENPMKTCQDNYDLCLSELFGGDRDANPLRPPFFDQLMLPPNKNNMKKLAWVIETDQSTYQPGEPIGFRLSLENISNEEARIHNPNLWPSFLLCSMTVNKILKFGNQKVNMTKEGSRFYSGNLNMRYWNGRSSSNKTFHMQPGDKVSTRQSMKTLNRYYDLSETGEYELTFYTRNFLGTDEEQIGEYPKPSTVRFKIEGTENWLNRHVHWEESEVNSPKEL